jgi:hypothetical protein
MHVAVTDIPAGQFEEYYTIDNGRKVYKVVLDFFDFVTVYKLKRNANGTYTNGKKILDIQESENNKRLGFRTMGAKQFRGTQYAPLGKFPGETVIVKTSDGQYIYIGHKVYSFKPIDNEVLLINNFYNHYSKSGISYPYYIGDKYTYFFRENMAVPNDLLGVKQYRGEDTYDVPEKDPYRMFYGEGISDSLKNEINASTRPFEINIIDNGLSA